MTQQYFAPEPLLEAYKHIKQLCHQHDQNVPTFVVINDDELNEGLMQKAEMDKPAPDAVGFAFIPYELPTSSLEDFLRGMRLAVFDGKPVAGVAFCSDAVYRIGTPDDPPPKRGDLQRAFEAGDSTVKEALQVVVVTPWGCSYATASYHLDDAGELVFDDDMTGGELGGLVPDSLQVMVTP